MDIQINRGDIGDEQAHADEFGAAVSPAAAHAYDCPEIPVPDAALRDERRMQGRAYNHWLNLISGNELPAIEDLHLDQLGDLAAQGVLLDLTLGAARPSIIVLGEKLAEDCGEGLEIFSVSDVPSRSLLSQLTDHCMEVAATLAPVGFEAEFADHKGRPILSRGILLPFSSNGKVADFIFGVISWTEAVQPAIDYNPERIDPAALTATGARPAANDLAGLLNQARQSALAARSGEERSREALYNAISVTYDFTLAAAAAPISFTQMLEIAGLKPRPRAPLVPAVRLIFGDGYDKTRIAEIATVLAHGRRHGLGVGGLVTLLRSAPGGLKALVAEERRLRRLDKVGTTKRRHDVRTGLAVKLRKLNGIVPDDPLGGGEFGLFVARRDFAGGVTLLGDLGGNTQLLETATRRLLARHPAAP